MSRKMLLLVLAAVMVFGLAAQAGAVGKYCLAYWREAAACENSAAPCGSPGNHSVFVHVWNEDGTPRAGVQLYTSWGVLLGTTDVNGFVEVAVYRPNGYDFQVRDGSNLTDTTPIFNTERPPTWGHYSWEAGFLYKADSANPGTFDTNYDGILNASGSDPCADLSAPRTRSLAYYSTVPTNYCSDQFALGNWSLSFGQTFVANGNRVIAAKAHPTIGGGGHFFWYAQILDGPNGSPIGPVSTSRETISDEYWPLLMKWGINDVPVVSGQTYYLKIWATDGMNVYHVTHDNYASGQYYENGVGVGGVDLEGFVLCANTTGGGCTAPSITTQPVSQTKNVGESVTFTVAASGTTPLSCQWRKGGSNISGATSSSYTIASVQTTDAGSYDCVVSNACGSATSNTATLTVSQSSSIASEDFETMPSWSSSFNAAWGSAAAWTITAGGQSGNFLRVARSSGGSSVKAKVYTVPTNTNITISAYMKCPSYGSSYWMEFGYRFGSRTAQDFDANPGSWTPIQKFSNSGYPNGNGNVWTQYSTTVNTGSDTEISIGYKLGSSAAGPTVGWDTFRIDGPGGCTAPAITIQPQSQTKCTGQSVTFTAAASGSAPLSYQWRKNGANISGATSASYTISSVTTGDAASYTCYVSNSWGNVTSNAATLTVNTPASITTQPASQTKTVGQSCTFTVAASGTTHLSYQWRKNGANISGATSSSYTIASVQTTDAGNYDCVVSNSCGSATSNVAVLTVSSGVIASEDFTSMPSWSSSYNAAWGSAASWSIVAGGQSGNFLQASRSSQGSSVKVKVYTVPQNTNITISIYVKCPSYSGGTYWIESGYRLGNYSAQDFDQNSGSWTLIQKFSNSGYPNGNGNVWTQYSVTVNTGSNTQISIGYKHGASGCTGPTVGWDTFRVQ